MLPGNTFLRYGQKVFIQVQFQLCRMLPNANVHPYPLAADEDRFFAYLSKDPLTAADKRARRYVTVNIDDLFDPSDPTGSTYKAVTSTNGLTPSSLANLFPAMMKFNHNFDGGWLGGNFQQKLGNIMIMRMAEVYLIAAEATLRSGGNGAAAAQYLNELRRRACRNIADFNAGYRNAVNYSHDERCF